MRHTDTIAFVKAGRFSYTNDSVLRLLRQQFPYCAIEVIDARPWHLLPAPALAPLAWAALRRHGPGLLAGKAALVKALMYTPEFHARSRAHLLQRLQRNRYLFTFQTQSLFDASVPGTPHFLYTDHTHLANLHYPAFDPGQLMPAQWLDAERAAFMHATVNFTMSTNIAASLVEQYGCRPQQVECVYVGTNTPAPPAPGAAPRDAQAPIILFVGVAWQRKGGPVLVEAFKRLSQQHAAARLLIVGCKPPLRVRNCEVIGRVPLAQVNDYYRRAAIFCVPTRIEPLGIVFLEAFAHGLPVVATRIGALPDFVCDGQTGYLVEPGDVDMLARRLAELLADPQQRRRFGERGRALVRQRYNWQATGAAMRAAILEHL